MARKHYTSAVRMDVVEGKLSAATDRLQTARRSGASTEEARRRYDEALEEYQAARDGLMRRS